MYRARVTQDLHLEVPDALEKIYADFEPTTTQVILDKLRPGDVFLDVGANFGYFALLAATIVGPSGRVYAVEASPAVLPMLAANVAKFPNVRIIDKAAGAQSGTTEFYMTEDYVNSGVAQSPFVTKAEKVSIPMDTLDNLLAAQPGFDGRLDFIKCDVQGDEVAVLQGLAQTIAANPRLQLIAEWAPAWMKNAGYDPDGFPAFLGELGFRHISAIDDYLRRRMSLEAMEDEFRRDRSGKRFCNLYASR